MPIQRLTCSRGHTWEQVVVEPLPDDLREICPMCAINAATTLEIRPANPPARLRAGTQEGNEALLAPGVVLAGFEILAELNRGGMGVIYKAHDVALNRLVALKVITPELLGNNEALKRFQREVQVAARLSHPNIVTVFRTDLEGPRPYLAMEYVPGIDLHRLVKRAGPLSVSEACDYVMQVAEGLQHAHEQGLVHRDIKPANLMVAPSPLDPSTPKGGPVRVKLLDLGLARMTAAAGGERSMLTLAGEFLGTPDFVSPEQAEDSRQADIRSDLYSLGCTFFFLLTGEVPFPSDNMMLKLRRQVTEPPPSLTQRRPDAPPGVDWVVQTLLARSPADRFQTPAELKEKLLAVLHHPEALAVFRAGTTPPPPPETFQTPAELREVLEQLAQADDAPSTLTTASQVLAHQGGVQALALSADGQLLLSGGLDRTLRLWEVPRLHEKRLVADRVGPVEQVCLTAKAKWAACCSLPEGPKDCVVQLWDLGTGRVVRRLRGATAPLRCVAVTADGRRVAAAGDDRTIRVWAVDQPGSPSLSLVGHTDRVSSVTFLPGNALLSGSDDGTVRLWNLKTGEVKKTLSSHFGPVAAVAFGGPSRRLALAGSGVRIREADGTSLTLVGHEGLVLCLAFSADGQFLLTGGSDRTVRLWRAEDGKELERHEGHADKVRAVVFNPDSTIGYSGSADGTLRRWSLRL